MPEVVPVKVNYTGRQYISLTSKRSISPRQWACHDSDNLSSECLPAYGGWE